MWPLEWRTLVKRVGPKLHDGAGSEPACAVHLGRRVLAEEGVVVAVNVARGVGVCGSFWALSKTLGAQLFHLFLDHVRVKGGVDLFYRFGQLPFARLSVWRVAVPRGHRAVPHPSDTSRQIDHPERS
jgi:hypothetical protein